MLTLAIALILMGSLLFLFGLGPVSEIASVVSLVFALGQPMGKPLWSSGDGASVFLSAPPRSIKELWHLISARTNQFVYQTCAIIFGIQVFEFHGVAKVFESVYAFRPPWI